MIWSWTKRKLINLFCFKIDVIKKWRDTKKAIPPKSDKLKFAELGDIKRQEICNWGNKMNSSVFFCNLRNLQNYLYIRNYSNYFILQSVHLRYKYAIRIHFSFIRNIPQGLATIFFYPSTTLKNHKWRISNVKFSHNILSK
jgi:hypothetical protein